MDRVHGLAPEGVDTATDLFGTEAIDAALDLGVAPGRISVINQVKDLPVGVHATGGIDAPPGALEQITDAIRAGTIRVPIAASLPIEAIRAAVALQASRRVHGKVVVTFS